MAAVKSFLGFNGDNAELVEQYKMIREVKSLRGIQARMPYTYEIE
jgi:hypothetical protein